jgi:hypothetical protein
MEYFRRILYKTDHAIILPHIILHLKIQQQ